MGIHDSFTRPCTPLTDGQAEHLIRTLLRQWAQGLAHPAPAARDDDRLCWLVRVSRSGSHSPLNGLSPPQGRMTA